MGSIILCFSKYERRKLIILFILIIQFMYLLIIQFMYQLIYQLITCECVNMYRRD